MGFRDELLARLPEIVIGTLAGRLGGPQALGRFQGGMQERAVYEDERAQQAAAAERQTQLDEERRQQQAYERQRQTATDQRAEESADLQRRQALLSALSQYDTDPAALAPFFNVPAEQAQAIAAPVVSQRERRAAVDFLKRLESDKRYEGHFGTPEGIAALDDTTVEWRGKQIKIRDIRGLAQEPMVPPKPAIPTRAPAAPGSFEAYVDAPPEEQARIEAARKRYLQADDRPAQSSDPSIVAQRRFTMEQRLATQWEKSSSPSREMRRQLLLMETGLKRFRAGDTNGGSQAVLVTFQKILDPTSVVRESEYARTAAGQSLLNRIEGFAERLAQGGAGMTDAELAAMVGTAREFLDGMQNFNAGTRQRLERTAKEYGLDPRMIFDDVDVGPTPTADPNAGWMEFDGGIRIRERK